MSVAEIAACMVERLPDDLSPVDVLSACSAIAALVVSRAPAKLRREVVEKYVSNFYEIVAEELKP